MESNTEPGWRIASDALSCPSMVRLNNFVERWSLRVRIEPDCDVCKDDKDRMEPDDDGSCRGCLRTASDYEPLGGWENEVTKKLVVEFYDNPQAKGEAVVTMEGNITYPNEKGVSMDGLRFGFGQTSGGGSQIHLFRMMQTYLKDTPNRLINKDYRVDRNYISQTMQRRFYMGGWIDEHSYSPNRSCVGQESVELRYDKPRFRIRTRLEDRDPQRQPSIPARVRLNGCQHQAYPW